MLKKKKLSRINLQNLFPVITSLLTLTNAKFITPNKKPLSNIFRLTSRHKQLYFSLLNTDISFMKLYSTGQLLIKPLRKFKFFKKTLSSINPLVLTLRFSFIEFFKNLYMIESLNYSKKQYIFFKKLISSITANIRYIIFKKTWQHTTRPVKRIKRRVVKMLKKL